MVNLREGQYQIGDLLFGNGTMIRVNSVEATGYTSNANDYQNPLSDEIRFGKDFITPATLLFDVGIMDNYALPGYSIPGIVRGDTLMEAMHKEWRADEVRQFWGYQKSIIYKRAGQQRRVFGRPRAFSAQPRKDKPGFYAVTCDYQRSDSFSYDDTEKSVSVVPTGAGTTSANIVRTGGKAPTWVQVFIIGPINNPVLKFGNLFTMSIQHNLAAGKIIELNSYPWERRVIDSDGFNLNPKLIAPSVYLDQARLPAETTIPVGLSGSSTTGATQAIFNWREAYHAF